MTTLPDFDALIRGAQASILPYRWLVRQSRCRACGNVHEQAPLLMRYEVSGWAFAVADDGLHESAPVVFEEKLLAWCEACHSPAAQKLTARVREATDMYSNSTILATRLKRLLLEFEKAQTKEHFHHA